MGGRLAIHVACSGSDAATAGRAAATVGARVDAWAARLTRFTTHSDLARLNADPSRTRCVVRPTLASVLSWALRASEASGGLVDVTRLTARLAAERPVPAEGHDGHGAWRLQAAARGGVVHRRAGTLFDLDGVAKGWLADRAADLLCDWPAALVDADGDISVRIGPGVEWFVGVADPRSTEAPHLALLRLAGTGPWQRALGVATSGTSVHRWTAADGSVRHHLIDPRTNRSAVTDVVQMTVIAPSAREAETLAKAALILGSAAGLALLDRSPAAGAICLLESGAVIALPRTTAWLA